MPRSLIIYLINILAIPNISKSVASAEVQRTWRWMLYMKQIIDMVKTSSMDLWKETVFTCFSWCNIHNLLVCWPSVEAILRWLPLYTTGRYWLSTIGPLNDWLLGALWLLSNYQLQTQLSHTTWSRKKTVNIFCFDLIDSRHRENNTYTQIIICVIDT